MYYLLMAKNNKNKDIEKAQEASEVLKQEAPLQKEEATLEEAKPATETTQVEVKTVSHEKHLHNPRDAFKMLEFYLFEHIKLANFRHRDQLPTFLKFETFAAAVAYQRDNVMAPSQWAVMEGTRMIKQYAYQIVHLKDSLKK